MGRKAKAALSLLPNLLLAIGAVLVGWGLDDVAGFFRNRARMALIAAVLAIYVFGTLLGIEYNPLRKGNSRARGWPILAGMSILPIL